MELIGFGSNDQWVGPLTMSLPLIVAFLAVCGIGAFVLVMDARNRAEENRVLGLGSRLETPDAIPAGSTITEPEAAVTSPVEEPPSREVAPAREARPRAARRRTPPKEH